MSVSYGGNKIIPAPVIQIVKRYTRQGDGTRLGVVYALALKGTILPFKGSPDSTGAFWTNTGYPPDEPYDGAPGEDFNHILRKQEALRELFAQEGKSLEWQPAGGQPVVKCNPRIGTLSFGEGQWSQRCDYTIEAEAETLYINGSGITEDPSLVANLRDATETWNFDETESKDGALYVIVHEVRAQAIRTYDAQGDLAGGKEAWQHARDWCASRATGLLDPSVAAEVLGSTINGRNYSKSTVVDRTGGACTITERWVGTHTEYSLDRTWDFSSDTAAGTYVIRYTGTVTGYGSDAATRLTNAKNGVPDAATAKADTLSALGPWVSGVTLPVSPVERSLGLNERDGTANFTYDWSTTAGATSTAGSEFTANLRFQAEANEYQLSLSQDVQGFGSSPTEKLVNAWGAVLADAAAKAKALSLLTGEWPVGENASFLIERSASSNETRGQVSKSWTWSTRDAHNLSVRVTTAYPGAVLAIIPIPGRLTGPIVQDMSTRTEQRTVVSLEGMAYASDPGDLASAYYSGGGKATRDERNWDPIRKTFSQTKEWVEMT